MGALAAARRTESSFPTFLASTNPSNLSLGTALYNPALGFTTGYNAPLVRTISHLPHVRHAESYADMYSTPLGADGEPTAAAENANMNVEGSVDGLFFDQDRVTVVQGRMADPNRADEIMMTAAAARVLGLHVGQTVPWGTYSNAQSTDETSSAGPPPKPALHERLTLVGTVVLNNAVVQDDIDANGPITVILTPALTRQLVTCCSNFSFTSLQLDHGSRDVAAVEAEIERVLPPVLPYDFYDTSIDVTKAQNAIKPEAIALGVFGFIAALAAILIAGQVIGRQLGFWAHEERTMRALGGRPGNDRGRRSGGDHRCGRPGRTDGRRRRRGALTVGPAGPGASLRPRPWRRLRLDRARLRHAGARRHPRRAGRRACRAAGSAPCRRVAQPSPHAVARRRRRRICRPARLGRHRHPLRPRTRVGGRRRAGALRRPRCGPDRGGRHRHRGVRRQPRLPRVATPPLRMELELRADGRRWGRRPPGCADGDAARPRLQRGRLVGVLVRQPADRRPHGARPRRVTAKRPWHRRS